ncbi:LmeA family phospholipid-binding protein [Actinoplanes oblitus]|uniref:LmeA family phospholipid-binding protein n=1 Tax=Actinoplanes oblitus TaxID=3040509 RepID=UPI00389953FD
MRKSWIILGVAVVLVGAGFAADRTAADRAADRLADRLRCVAGTDVDPKVSFGGVPFLTQWMRGTYSSVRVRAPRLAVGNFTAALDATAHEVRVPHGGPIQAKSLTADITVPYAGLGAAEAANGSPGDAPRDSADSTFGWDGDGKLTIGTNVRLLGRPRSVTVYATLTVAGTALTIQPTEVGIPLLGLRVSADRLGDRARVRTVDLPHLPAGLSYQGARAIADGLRLTITGSNLRTLPRGVDAPAGRCG